MAENLKVPVGPLRRPPSIGTEAANERGDPQQVSPLCPCQKPARDAPAQRAKANTLYGLKTQSASWRPEEAELDRYGGVK